LAPAIFYSVAVIAGMVDVVAVALERVRESMVRLEEQLAILLSWLMCVAAKDKYRIPCLGSEMD
jgi:hypothetical protein